MADYKYDKKILRGLSVSPFLHEVKTRNEAIEAQTCTEIPSSVFPANELASSLHPGAQQVLIREVRQLPGAREYVLVPDQAAGGKDLAFFRAGQYISIPVETEGHTLYMPYTLVSSPKEALDNEYRICIKENRKGELSRHILETWNPGKQLEISGPLGEFYYTRLRDAKKVAALAGGSGITPFMSMAQAIRDGLEDFELTIFYGCNKEEEILYKDKLDRLAKDPRIRVVYVLAWEKKDGFETGTITSQMIQKYMEGEYSVFVCGPAGMQRFLKEELPDLHLSARRIRFEVPGELSRPQEDPTYLEPEKDEFEITVKFQDAQRKIPCKASWSLLNAMERAGLKAPAHCRSGQCGWCHSRLISGKVFIPFDRDGRREADKKFGWIHPCIAYPLSDIVLEVPVFLHS